MADHICARTWPGGQGFGLNLIRGSLGTLPEPGSGIVCRDCRGLEGSWEGALTISKH